MGETRRCVYEADHIHNLPQLMVDYAPELLEFYWNVERPLLVRQITDAECTAFHDSWNRLGSLVERECKSIAASENVLADPLSL